MINAQAAVIRAVKHEREQQDIKWGEQNHSDETWYLIAGEEFGELAEAILKGDIENIEAELTQLTAVCLAWMECKERQAFSEYAADLDSSCGP